MGFKIKGKGRHLLFTAFLILVLIVDLFSEEVNIFPFVLPWDDSEISFTNISDWNHKPAGKFGYVKVGEDGHLYVGEKRIRFFGVNLPFAGCFHNKSDIDKITKRLSKFGINIVRLFYVDTGHYPEGIFTRGKEDTRSLDLEALDWFDYLVYKLKENGIYLDLRLLIARPFNRYDGLPQEIETINWQVRKSIGFFYEPLISLQKEYAKQILTHKNPYTKMTYAEDPCVAFIEIINENGLIHSWLGGELDNLPEVFSNELQRQWNEYLKKKYKTTINLRESWQMKVEENRGRQLLSNNDFSRGFKNWFLEQQKGTKAIYEFTDDIPPSVGGKSLRLKIEKGSDNFWDLKFYQSGLNMEAHKFYTLSFWAKADSPREISIAVLQSHQPWKNLGVIKSFKLEKNWKKFSYTFQLTEGDHDARLSFTSLAQEGGIFYFAGISLCEGGSKVGLKENEKLENKSIPIFLKNSFDERSYSAQYDWIEFLWEKENNYYQTMYNYIKKELGAKGLIIGTASGWSTPNIMGHLDIVDAHGYWQHPTPPQGPEKIRIVRNITMVNSKGGTLSHISLRRVLGKPFTVTEYNHPAPNTYSSEAFPLISAYGALQDWDAIFIYAYGFGYTSGRDNWDQKKITGWFDINQHPNKLVTLIPSAAMFIRGDVKPANKEVIVYMDKKGEIDKIINLANQGRRMLPYGATAGLIPETSLIHKVSIAIEGMKLFPKGEDSAEANKETTKFISDTGELVWDLSDEKKGLVTVNTSKSKALIGFSGGKRIKLGSVEVEVFETLQNGWCVITLTAMKGDMENKGPVDILITATGYIQNTDMKWKDDKKSIIEDWGKEPTLVEGISARIILPYQAEKVKAWVLDERGKRKEEMEVKEDENGKSVINIGPKWQTLWYEVSYQP